MNMLLGPHSAFRFVVAVGMLMQVAPCFAIEDAELTALHRASEARLIDSVKYLASNDLEGRGVNTEGIQKAANYIAEHFEQCGLNIRLFDGSPFQPFSIDLESELGNEADNYLNLICSHGNGADGDTSTPLQINKDYAPLAIGGTAKFHEDLVFAGYGITATNLGYDDYAEIDVSGKVVVLLRKEPQQDDADSVFSGRQPSTHATFQAKLRNAEKHGAAAVIIVNDDHMVRTRTSEKQRALDKAIFRLVATHAEFRGLDQPDAEKQAEYTRKVEQLSDRIHQLSEELNANNFDELMGFQQAGSRKFADTPLFFVARKHVDALLAAAKKKSLAEIEHDIDRTLKPYSFALEGCSADGAVDIVTKELEVKNVVGVLEGEGPLADETIVVGAHYDHLGKGGAGSLAPWTVDIHNGADDNASGTAALLEICQRLTDRHQKPKRRIVFIAFTGEERGLLGSAHYVRNPRFDLEKTVAMVNLDMVGRLTDDELTVYGTGTATEFDELIDKLNSEYDFELTKKSSGFGPSDHTSFYTKKIPVLFPFTGLHRDYHRPSDDWDKINVEGLRRVTDFSMDIVTAIEEMPQRPTYVEKGRWGSIFDEFRRGRRSARGADREPVQTKETGSDDRKPE